MSVHNKTYNNVINTLLLIAEGYHGISTTSVGDIFDIDLEKNTKYPLMHINPLNVTTGRVALTYNFQIFVMDMVDTDDANEQDVYNDVLQTCVDIISIFRNSKYQSENNDDINEPIYFTEGDYTLEPFTERFDNELTGWVFTIAVTTINNFDACTIPVVSQGAGE